MAENYITKYQCFFCEKNHETSGSAAACCVPEVYTVYFCEVCEQERDRPRDARSCCVNEED